MNRRDAIRAGAAAIAGLAAPGPLLAATGDQTRPLLVLVDPALEASRSFGGLLAGGGAAVITLARNRLVAWHRDILPRVSEGGRTIVGLTHAADAQFLDDAGREAGLRQEAAWLHARRGDRFDHRALKAACSGAAVRRLECAGERWIEQAAVLAADRRGGADAGKRRAVIFRPGVHDLVSWRIA